MKKRNSVLANLTLSYVTIVLVIVLLLCSTLYLYFSKHYKEELRNQNQLTLENTAQTIESTVFQRVQQLYLDISLNTNIDLRLFNDSSDSVIPSKVISLQALLKSKVANNSELVSAIHLYYPRQRVMLSSTYGLELNADQGNSAVYFSDWINEFRSHNKSEIWTSTRLVPNDIFSSLPGSNDNALFTYAHSYSIQSSRANSDLIIAVDVKEDVISGIIRNMMPSQYINTFILDQSGNTISDSDINKLGLQHESDSGITKALLSGTAFGSFNETIGHTAYAISFQSIPTSGWKIYSAVPADTFYEKSHLIQKSILGICMFALLLGIALSGVFALANYSPIKRLVNKIKSLTDQSPDHVMNEYGLIDSAFVKLNDKVSSLEETLQANNSVIKHNVVLNMLRNGYTREELAEELPYLGIPQGYTHYCCLLLNSDKKDVPFANWLINQLEIQSFPESRMIAEELPDKKIVVMVCSLSASDTLLEQFSGRVLSMGKTRFDLNGQISWGSWVKDLGEIHISFNEAESMMKYGYFQPELSVLKDLNLLERESSLDEIPQSFLNRFREKLQLRDTNEIAIAVDHLIGALREGTYAADYCRFVLANTVFIYSDYLKSVRYKHDVNEHPDLHNQLLQIRDIHEYRTWLMESIASFVDQMEKRTSERATSSIEFAKQYIHDHLSEDLSLDAVAAKVFISPKYLSRLFKEVLGVTYTDYVTTRRMEKARTLIEGNKMTIEQISNAVGYGTVAYFIKKFKDIHGCTPGTYLRNAAKHA